MIPFDVNGSSPRVRGKPGGAGNIGFQNRIIPARAGQTCPRVRTRTRRPGSSPRVRGKRVCRSPLEEPYRIIPARAGQTRAWPYCPAKPSDHPSACGANEASDLAEAASDGSSPRVRGKPGGTCSPCQFPRIIPARAGQTHAPYQDCRAHPDHPRACGANHGGQSVYTADTGSSPRVRGKLLRGDGRLAVLRIIPARAGQTILYHYSSSLVPDHPRACGANLPRAELTVGLSGSSPRVRGKRRRFPTCP